MAGDQWTPHTEAHSVCVRRRAIHSDSSETSEQKTKNTNIYRYSNSTHGWNDNSKET